MTLVSPNFWKLKFLQSWRIFSHCLRKACQLLKADGLAEPRPLVLSLTYVYIYTLYIYMIIYVCLRIYIDR